MHTCTIGLQDARIHVSEPDFDVLTQGGLLVDSSIDGGITIVEFERIMRAQLTLHVQAGPFCWHTHAHTHACTLHFLTITPSLLVNIIIQTFMNSSTVLH
jgi:hypothetical protein